MPELTEITEIPAKVEETAARIEDDDDDSDDTIPELEDTGKLNATCMHLLDDERPAQHFNIVHSFVELKVIPLLPLAKRSWTWYRKLNSHVARRKHAKLCRN